MASQEGLRCMELVARGVSAVGMAVQFVQWCITNCYSVCWEVG